MSCLVRLEKGICGKPHTTTIRVRLPPEDYVLYLHEVADPEVPMCDEHAALVAAGWSLHGKVVFRWVPPA